jgi:hypothetical protein
MSFIRPPQGVKGQAINIDHVKKLDVDDEIIPGRDQQGNKKRRFSLVFIGVQEVWYFPTKQERNQTALDIVNGTYVNP